MKSLQRCLTFLAIAILCPSDSCLLSDSKWNLNGMEKAIGLLDVSRDYIKKAKTLFPNCADDSNCEQKQAMAFLDVAMNLINQVKTDYPTTSHDPDPTECPKEEPTDCADILRNGNTSSGVYSVWPKSRIATNNPISVYCDMDTDKGGWTVIQRRGNFSTPKDYFYKDWADYKNGFGNITEEFWIGNDNIFAISNQANYSIRFDLEDHTGDIGYAVYDTFWIEDEAANYTLHITGYNGNVGDSMGALNKMKFSTRDRNNDKWSSRSCAKEYQGAWWYRMCTNANLNGLYQPGTNSDTGMTWLHWKMNIKGLAWVEIKLRS